MKIRLVATILFGILSVSLVSSVADDAKPLTPVWTVTEGCDAPESTYLDPVSGVVFVSNISGQGAEKDGKGWISKITTDGKVLSAKWVEGLNAPKGIRSYKTTLWVSDVDTIVEIDITKAKIVNRIPVPGAKFLNDVACGPDGTVYVSDMIGSKVFQVQDGKVSVFAEGDELESPNGLLVDGDRLILGGWGLTTDFMPKVPGRLFALDLKTKKKTLITKEPTGNLDGIESDGHGGYIVSDWVAGKILHISGSGKVQLLAQFPKGAADLAYIPAKHLLILPQMMENKITAFDLTKFLSQGK
ncbi:MAG: hypothetical protein JWM11_2753 [Planctomycetaceae bacterium]|nr:hypothetical protein [Planctomycetaceae bacterium]